MTPREIFLAVADRIEQDPARYEQGWWYTPTECGTAYCVAGHICCVTGRYREGENYPGYFPWQREATAALGDLDVSPLFNSCCRPSMGMPQYLRRIAEGDHGWWLSPEQEPKPSMRRLLAYKLCTSRLPDRLPTPAEEPDHEVRYTLIHRLLPEKLGNWRTVDEEPVASFRIAMACRLPLEKLPDSDPSPDVMEVLSERRSSKPCSE